MPKPVFKRGLITSFFSLELEMSVVGIPHIFNSEVHDFEPSPNWSCFQLVPFALRSICGLLLFFLTSFFFGAEGFWVQLADYRDSTDFMVMAIQITFISVWSWPSMAIHGHPPGRPLAMSTAMRTATVLMAHMAPTVLRSGVLMRRAILGS